MTAHAANAGVLAAVRAAVDVYAPRIRDELRMLCKEGPLKAPSQHCAL